MQLLKSEQYQNINNLDLVFRTYQYNEARVSDYFYFDSIIDWNTAVAGITPLTNSDNGLEVFAGVDRSGIGIKTIQTFNPLSVLSQKTTKPYRLLATGKGGARKTNKNYKDLTRSKFVLKNVTGANNVVAIRYYTDNTLANYYNVSITLPVANTHYHVKYSKFINGTYGVVGTAVTINGRLTNTAQAIVTTVGSPVGTVIDTIAIIGTTVVGEVKPISLHEANNDYQFAGQSISIPACCTKDLVDSLEQEYQVLKCGTKDSGKVKGATKLDIVVTVQKRMQLLLAMSYTTELIEQVLKLTGKAEMLTVTNATGTLAGTVNSANLAMIALKSEDGCVALQRDYIHNTSATLDPNFFFLNEANGTLTFSDSLTATEVEAYPYVDQLATTFDLYSTLNPYRMILEYKQKSVGNTQNAFGLYLVDLGAGVKANDDESNTWEFTNSVVIDGYDKAIQGTY